MYGDNMKSDILKKSFRAVTGAVVVAATVAALAFVCYILYDPTKGFIYSTVQEQARNMVAAVSPSRADPSLLLQDVSFYELMARGHTQGNRKETVWGTEVGIERRDDSVVFLFDAPKEYCQTVVGHAYHYFDKIIINGSALSTFEQRFSSEKHKALMLRDVVDFCQRTDADTENSSIQFWKDKGAARGNEKTTSNAVEAECSRLNAQITQRGRRAYRLAIPQGLLNHMFLGLKGVKSLDGIRYCIGRMAAEARAELVEAERSVNTNILMWDRDMKRNYHLFPDCRALIMEKDTEELRAIIDVRLTEERAKIRLNAIRVLIGVLPDKAASYQDEISILERLVTNKA